VNDVTGMPQTAVVLGGASDLARAVLRRLASRRLHSIVLAGRDEAALVEAGKELSSLGVNVVEASRFDVRETMLHESFAANAQRRLGSIDLLLVATGMLGAGDLDALDAETVANSVETNFTGPAAAIIAFVNIMRRQGYGRIVVFSSVAGVRVRRSNFVYGGAKAGLDGFCQGLGDALSGSGVELMIVRPGFVRTKMTAARTPAPFAANRSQRASCAASNREQKSCGSRRCWRSCSPDCAVSPGAFGAYFLSRTLQPNCPVAGTVLVPAPCSSPRTQAHAALIR
jgi:decaprenylphospho-beta-D-erythro-pentofuranosid-2-ulose 2-reductase